MIEPSRLNHEVEFTRLNHDPTPGIPDPWNPMRLQGRSRPSRRITLPCRVGSSAHLARAPRQASGSGPLTKLATAKARHGTLGPPISKHMHTLATWKALRAIRQVRKEVP